MNDAGRGARRALITGASRGIGAEMARAAPRDLDLVLVARDPAALAAMAEELSSEGRVVETEAVDLADQEALDGLIERQRERVDLLVNNAGLGAYGRFLDAPGSRQSATVLVNALAPTRLAHALLPGMMQRARISGRRAGLINMASGVAFAPTPGLAVYAATKAYVLSFTEALGAELSGEPVDVLAVCPGAVRSRFGERAGFGGSFPGAMDPDHVAKRAWEALGRQRTVVVGPLSSIALSPVAFARSAAAEVGWRGLRLMERVRR